MALSVSCIEEPYVIIKHVAARWRRHMLTAGAGQQPAPSDRCQTQPVRRASAGVSSPQPLSGA
jgi:hypothetical protein